MEVLHANGYIDPTSAAVISNVSIEGRMSKDANYYSSNYRDVRRVIERTAPARAGNLNVFGRDPGIGASPDQPSWFPSHQAKDLFTAGKSLGLALQHARTSHGVIPFEMAISALDRFDSAANPDQSGGKTSAIRGVLNDLNRLRQGQLRADSQTINAILVDTGLHYANAQMAAAGYFLQCSWNFDRTQLTSVAGGPIIARDFIKNRLGGESQLVYIDARNATEESAGFFYERAFESMYTVTRISQLYQNSRLVQTSRYEDTSLETLYARHCEVVLGNVAVKASKIGVPPLELAELIAAHERRHYVERSAGGIFSTGRFASADENERFLVAARRYGRTKLHALNDGELYQAANELTAMIEEAGQGRFALHRRYRAPYQHLLTAPYQLAIEMIANGCAQPVCLSGSSIRVDPEVQLERLYLAAFGQPRSEIEVCSIVLPVHGRSRSEAIENAAKKYL